MSNIEMSYLTLEDLFTLSLNHNLPFAAYRIPGENTPHIITQLSSQLNKLNEDQNIFNTSGFIVKPYKETSTTPTVLIALDLHIQGYQISLDNLPSTLISRIEEIKSKGTNANLPKKTAYSLFSEEGRGEIGFTKSIEKIKQEIKKGTITKAVLSRIIRKEIGSSFSPAEFFTALASNYPGAFVSLIHLPDIGCWMGASPELLLSIHGNSLETVSLAGTQKTTGLNTFSWGEKELHEQQIVTDYIRTCLEKYFNQVMMSGPETSVAGPVAHLKTVFNAKMESNQANILNQFIREFHPTPALAGIPKDKAMELIDKLERHDRAYYTGFLGPVNMNNKTQLFINLRCMQLLKDAVAIFVGAGITSGSDPQSEWEETQMKANSMLDILNIKPQYVG